MQVIYLTARRTSKIYIINENEAIISATYFLSETGSLTSFLAALLKFQRNVTLVGLASTAQRIVVGS